MKHLSWSTKVESLYAVQTRGLCTPEKVRITDGVFLFSCKLSLLTINFDNRQIYCEKYDLIFGKGAYCTNFFLYCGEGCFGVQTRFFVISKGVFVWFCNQKGVFRFFVLIKLFVGKPPCNFLYNQPKPFQIY